jgi:hypothetical protein
MPPHHTDHCGRKGIWWSTRRLALDDDGVDVGTSVGQGAIFGGVQGEFGEVAAHAYLVEADAGDGWDEHGCDGAVVVTDHGQVAGNGEAGADGRAENCRRDVVVVGDHGSHARVVPRADSLLGGCGPVVDLTDVERAESEGFGLLGRGTQAGGDERRHPGVGRGCERQLAVAQHLARWVVQPGDYTIQIGHNSAGVIVAKTITLTGDVIKRELSLNSTVGEWFTHPLVGPAIVEKLANGMTEEQAAQAKDTPDWLRMVDSLPMSQFTNFLAGSGADLPTDTLTEMIELSRNS